ncbi:glucoamylase family protein [Mucilaginibacter segetis]|uniref:Ig-like domain-containing protein n=1 Tax=Mucilaginibacter segetis TaxID=2793071 RepID=A0A934PX07_9SPHI|nr:glucoamylase family protein [Mucilaginibacter segetis]MBK0381252.1 Ig-like domain-containing protein [Mucilaginibacter segetis]
MRDLKIYAGVCLIFLIMACKSNDPAPSPVHPVIPPASLNFNALKVNGVFNGFTYTNVNNNPVIKISFSSPVDEASVANALSIKDKTGANVTYTSSYENNDSTIVIKPVFNFITKYTVSVSTALKSAKSANLQSPIDINLTTGIDPADKFPAITDNELLDLVQKQTLKYFYDFGHPVSGLARERNTSGDVVTTGGSGFGIMAMVVGIDRGFISRADGLARLQKIVGFLKNNAQKFHGAFPHWLNGVTGAVVPFSQLDNGADLVETSYLMQGLLTARQYFNGAGSDETTLRADINTLWNGVEWDWFRQNNQDVLYWHWSPDKGWAINMKISGWNEGLIVYALAASSPTHAIPKSVYDNGWAGNGSMKNGNTYYGVQLPLGPAQGGPLFFEHYSFLGINPNGLSDAYADYGKQTKAHTLINYNYCVANPKNYFGYGAACWGLTASDIDGGYTASSPTNDVGVIAPTAALSSLPYTPDQSMAALRYFYYKLGDKLWGQYGFYDAFSLNDTWFANSYLAIDQGPIICMIENYRSGLLWNLFMSCPEIKTGMKNLGFQGPHL